MNSLCEQLERVAKSAATASERAIAVGAVANAALSSLCARAGEKRPDDDSMLAKLSGDAAHAFFRERGELAEGVDFIRILRDNARHGRRIRPKDVDLALDSAFQLVAALDGSGVRRRPHTLSERETRLLYVDVYLSEAGWEVMADRNGIHPGKACIEIKVEGMAPNGQNGYCDYVLFGRDNRPLAVVEAKRTIENADKGRTQVRLYGECLERRYGVKPVLYFTNGHDIWIDDRIYPERRVSAFHSLDDLERLVQRQARGRIVDTKVNADIAGRPYQIRAVRAVCERLDRKERHGLLVMATGTGKTRTVIATVEILARHDWIKNVLFLADRTELVRQAYKAFAAHYPQTTYSVLSEPSLASDPDARITLSTYQTMIRKIGGDEKAFASGHFDLIVVDEAHRSIFHKYAVIFDYFDALMIGLTATPREQVDASTYACFHCEQGKPDFEYTMEEGFREGYLKPWKLFNRTTAALRAGIRYDELAAAEKELYEHGFEEAGQVAPDLVEPDELFRTVYNRATCKRIVEELMEHGLKVENGELLGKSVVFAANHEHARMIYGAFCELYPDLATRGFCELIDNHIKFADTLVEKFKEQKTPRLAISVDMLDTGIDVPEILNLVYFRRVRSKIKFYQMLGRGTRVCKDVFGPGKDKERFFVFDYCGNFEYFIGNGGEGVDELDSALTVTQRVFVERLRLMRELQSLDQQAIPARHGYWLELFGIVSGQIASARANFRRISVRKVLPCIEKYLDGTRLKALSKREQDEIELRIAPVIEGDVAEPVAVKLFDCKMLKVEQAIVRKGNADSAQGEVIKIRKVARRLMEKGAVPEVLQRKDALVRMASSDFWSHVSLEDVEAIRRETRCLMPLLDGDAAGIVHLDVDDQILDRPEVVGTGDFRTYREKVIDYLNEHSDSPAVKKLFCLEKMDRHDIDDLEGVLWRELGSEDDYLRAKAEAQHEGTLVGFLRSLIDLDDDAIRNRFGAFLNDHTFNSRQHEFIQSIVDYLRENGEVTPEALVNKPPFDTSPYLNIFADRMNDFVRLVEVVRQIVAA